MASLLPSSALPAMLAVALLASTCGCMGRERNSDWRLAIDRLTAADERVSTAEIVADLDFIRTCGRIDRDSLAAILPLASENSSLYANRDKLECARLYPYVLLVLADIGGLDAILPRAADLVAHGHTARELAVGARIIARAGPRGKWTQRFLAAAISRSLHDEPLSLERFSTDSPIDEQTTARVELVRAIIAVDPDPNVARDVLQQLYRQHSYGLGPGDPTTALQHEIETALTVLNNRHR